MHNKFLNISHRPTSGLIDLIKENIIGTPGQGMLYQHMEAVKKIDHIPEPYYANLSKGPSTIGTCCFCSRNTLNNGKDLPSFYLRYFTFKNGFRTTKQTDQKGKIKHSTLRQEIINLLSGDGLGDRAKNKFFHYAYVDPRNFRSALLCKEFGFETVRQFSTLIFNRINPVEDKSVEEISVNQIDEVKTLLKSFYKSHTMFSFENLFGIGKYYVIRDENNDILAGVQATADSWKILELPGISGKIILNTFSYVPFLKKLINKNYKFLTLEGIYYRQGNEKYLETLIESLLAKYKRNSAMIWVDKNSSLYQDLRTLDLGLVDKLNKEVQANVICKFVNFDNNEINEFIENPAYISGIDLT